MYWVFWAHCKKISTIPLTDLTFCRYFYIVWMYSWFCITSNWNDVSYIIVFLIVELLICNKNQRNLALHKTNKHSTRQIKTCAVFSIFESFAASTILSHVNLIVVLENCILIAKNTKKFAIAVYCTTDNMYVTLGMCQVLPLTLLGPILVLRNKCLGIKTVKYSMLKVVIYHNSLLCVCLIIFTMPMNYAHL